MSTGDGVLQIKQHAVKFVYNCATWHVFLRPLEIRSDCSGGGVACAGEGKLTESGKG